MALKFDIGLGFTELKGTVGPGGDMLFTECHSSCEINVFSRVFNS